MVGRLPVTFGLSVGTSAGHPADRRSPAMRWFSARAEVQVVANRVDVVDGHHRVRISSCDQPALVCAGPGLLQPRIHPLAEQRRRAGRHLVLALDVRERLTGAVEAAVGVPDAGRDVDVEHLAEALPLASAAANSTFELV